MKKMAPRCDQLKDEIALLIESLLENEEIMVDGDIQTSIQQANLCEKICHILTTLQQQQQQQPTEPLSARAAFSAVPKPSLRRISQVLSSLQSNRVDNEILLPSTMDDRANHDAMAGVSKAMTLTRTSLAAAELYSRILVLPGVVGAGLVEMEALAALSNVVRRWQVEMCGREKNLNRKSKGKSTRKTSTKSNAHTESGESDSDNENYNQPTKRSRLQPSKKIRFQSIGSDSDSDNEGTNGAVIFEDEKDGIQLSASGLFKKGVIVTKVLIQIPSQKEFTSWSPEAKEIIIKTVCIVMGTTEALSLRGLSRASEALPHTIPARDVAQEAAFVLERCIIDPHNDSASFTNDDSVDENSNATLSKKHETTKFLLRGLFPLIAMEEVLPNGDRGKSVAAILSLKVFESFLSAISNDVSTNSSRWPISFHQMWSQINDTPSSYEKLNHSSPTTPERTPRTKSIRTSPAVSNVFMSPKLKSSRRGSLPAAAMTGTKLTSRPIFSLILGFLQKIASMTEGRERAANRVAIVDGIRSCLFHLPLQERNQFLLFVVRLCDSKLSVHRLIGSELIGSIFSEHWLWGDDSQADTNQESVVSTSVHKRRGSIELPIAVLKVDSNISNITTNLFGGLQGRLSDRYPTIRASSANALSNILRPLTNKLDTDDDFTGTIFTISHLGVTRALCDESISLLSLLRRRIENDDKATVRRACIVALVELLVLGEFIDDFPISISEIDIAILSDVCHTSGLLTRRAALEGLTRLLKVGWRLNCIEIIPSLEKAWSLSTTSMILDSDGSCSSKAAEVFDLVIFQPILNNVDEEATQSAWRILSIIGVRNNGQGDSRNSIEGLRVALSKSAVTSSTNNFMVNLFKRAYEVAIKTTNSKIIDNFGVEIEAQRTGVWCLLNAAMEYTKNQDELNNTVKKSKINLNFLCTCWEALHELFQQSTTSTKQRGILEWSMQNCLQILSRLADMVNDDVAERTSKILHQLIADFCLSTKLIGSAISALNATIVSYSGKKGEDAIMNCTKTIRALYGRCEEAISEHSGDFINDTAVPFLGKVLFTIGELSMVGFSSDEESHSNTHSISDSTEELSHKDTMRGVFAQPNNKLLDFVQVFMADTLPGFGNIKTPESLRAHAFVAFGKVCLRNEKLAQQSLNLFARELYSDPNHDRKPQPGIQSNALLILGDLCIRYTNLVDRFLPVMAVCLQAGVLEDRSVIEITPANGGTGNVQIAQQSALVRKHAVLLLSNLLLQDYIKWRGLLFHRFLVAYVDEVPDVSNLVEMVLKGPLLNKQPKLFSNHFVESIFVLNRCTAHPIYVIAASTGDGGSGISVGFDGINLSGELGRVQRLQMYCFMLSKMNDEEKITVTARIAKDVLGGAVKGSGDIHRVCTMKYDPVSLSSCGKATQDRYESAYDVLSDALTILASPDIRVGGKHKHDEDVDDDIYHDDVTQVTNQSKKVQQAKGRLLSNISRKHMIDILLPILCNMKQLVQKNCCSILLQQVMQCLVVYYELYKEDVKECLVRDPTLLQEIDYDSRQYKKKQQQQQQREGLGTTPGTRRKQQQTPGTTKTRRKMESSSTIIKNRGGMTTTAQ